MNENILGILFFNLDTFNVKLWTLFFTETEILAIDTSVIKNQYKELQESEKIGVNRTFSNLTALASPFFGLTNLVMESEKSAKEWKKLKESVTSSNMPLVDYKKQKLTPKLLELAIKDNNRFPYEKIESITIEKMDSIFAFSWWQGSTILKINAGLLSGSWIIMSSASETQKLIKQTPLASKFTIK